MKIGKSYFLLATIYLLTFSNVIVAQKLHVKKRGIQVDHTIKSKIMDKEYQLYFSFPPEYSLKDTIAYPVLYVLDGRIMFPIVDGTRVHLDLESKIEDVIIVCINSGNDISTWQSNRTYEFTPSEDKNVEEFKSGGAKKFLECIKTEIIPFVDKHYKTNSNNGILGHSLGGLFVTYSLLKEPDLFNRYGISSPSLMWKNNELLNQAESTLITSNVKNGKSKKIFISAGGEEELAMVSGMKELSALIQKMNNKNIELSWNIFKNETHLSVVPAMISRALSTLYKAN